MTQALVLGAVWELLGRKMEKAEEGIEITRIVLILDLESL